MRALRWNGLSGTNTLAYYRKLYFTAIKSLISFETGVSLINLVFSSTLTLWQNKLERLSITVWPVWPGAYPEEEH